VYVCPESHRSYKREEELHVVITGVEVQGCGSGGGGGDVQVAGTSPNVTRSMSDSTTSYSKKGRVIKCNSVIVSYKYI